MPPHDASYQLSTERIPLTTKGECHIIDVTGTVADLVSERGLQEGHVLLFVPGSTGGLTTVEYEPGLLRDLPELFERLAPRGARYHHDDTWHDGNGHSHVRASLLGPSLMVPVVDGQLTLGTWQQIIFLDFDNRGRRRQLVAQLAGHFGDVE